MFTHEFGLNYDGLKEEATKAIALLNSGESLETSEDYKINKVNESMNLLSRFYDENGKKIIVFSDR